MHNPAMTTDRIEALRRDLVRKVRQVGVLRTVEHCAQKLLQAAQARAAAARGPQTDPFDSRYGTDTAGRVSVGALDIPDEKLASSYGYQAAVPEVFDAALRELPIRHPDYTFVDLGSGKGRAVLLASRHPFRAVVGLELSPALTAIAQENLCIFPAGERRCHAVELLCGDATNFRPPAGNTVLFLFNPFDDRVMAALVRSIEAALRETPRRQIYVVYQRPLYRAVWDASAAFEELCCRERYVIWRSR